MELHCPHCQKQLIIEDQYAGQPMKCPMCEGTFDAPSIPSYSASESSLPGSAEQASPAGETPPPPPGGMPPQQPESPAPPYQDQPAAPPPPYEEPVRATVHKSHCGLYFSPNIIQWIVVGAMVLIFLLSFFPWVWFGFGGVEVFSQNGWQAAFGGYSVNESFGSKVPIDPTGEDGPGVSVLSIFYLLLLLLTLPLVTAAAILSILKLNLPSGVRMALNFKWVIAGSFVILTFFLLLLQVLTGFSAEAKIYEQANQMPGVASDDTSPDAALRRGMMTAGLQRGFALSWVFWLHLLAVIAAAFICWMDLRKTAPVPKLEFHW